MDLVNRVAGVFQTSYVGLDLVRQDGAALLLNLLNLVRQHGAAVSFHLLNLVRQDGAARLQGIVGDLVPCHGEYLLGIPPEVDLMTGHALVVTNGWGRFNLVRCA